jgi:hypothetical protein
MEIFYGKAKLSGMELVMELIMELIMEDNK